MWNMFIDDIYVFRTKQSTSYLSNDALNIDGIRIAEIVYNFLQGRYKDVNVFIEIRGS